MALSYDHGAIQWLAADAATTTYVVSSMAFQPKALRFWWMGIASATDATSTTAHERRGMGFATSTSDRRCVSTFSEDAAATSNCSSAAYNNSIAATADGAGTVDGLLDLTALASDGFTLTVDDAAPANITVFWEAWGGTDITVAACVDIPTPAAAGNQNYTVTGFVSAATDQVVFVAGVQSNIALNSALAEASSFSIGATASTTAADNINVGGSADDANATMNTDGWGLDGQLIGMIVAAGGAMTFRAVLTAWITNGFTLNWIEANFANRRFVGLAIKGGAWKSGSFTIDSNTLNATATISGLTTPVMRGVNLMSAIRAETAADSVSATDCVVIGCGTSTSSRRSMSLRDVDATASSVCEINQAIEYDQVYVNPSVTGTVTASFDINAVNSDGYQFIMDVASGSAGIWVGYVMFGDAGAAPAAPIKQMMHHYKTMAAA